MPTLLTSTAITALQLKYSSSPGTPSTGFGRVYVNASGVLHYIDAAATDLDISAGVTGNAKLASANTFADATDASSSTTGAQIISGGVGIAKKLYVGTVLNVGTTAQVGTFLGVGVAPSSTIPLRVATAIQVSNGGKVGFHGSSGAATLSNYFTGDDGANTVGAVAGASGGVQLTSGATAWAAVSDVNAKTGFKPITGAIQKLSGCRTVTGRYKGEKKSVSRAFFVAQDWLKVLPESVTKGKKGLVMRYTDTLPLIAAAVNETNRRIDALERKQKKAA